jgi:short-subunit dehydrogenase
MAIRNHLGTVLITGASTGIGATYADRLARRGYDLILVARNRERLDALARRITNETQRSVEVMPADLNERADLARVENKLRSDASITMLVNNAGTAAITPLADSDVNQLQSMIELNVTALSLVARATSSISAPSSVSRPKC